MYNLSLPNLCATCSSLATLRLPTVDPYSAEVPGEMRSHTVLCGDLYIYVLVQMLVERYFGAVQFCEVLYASVNNQVGASVEVRLTPVKISSTISYRNLFNKNLM